MIIGSEIKYGELFLVDFDPSLGHEYQGKRPALVVESNKQIKKSSLVTILPLTSNLDNKANDDIFIETDKDNRLKFNSIIKVYNVVSFDHLRFINKIGKVDQATLKEVKDYLLKHFDL
jgi:mRNA interferase MazF